VVGDLQGLAGVEIAPTPQAALAGTDACVIVTEWPEIVTLDWAGLVDTMAGPVVIDGRNALDPAEMTRAGYRYEGIGRLPDAVPGAVGPKE
jgi:UDPglucose 6-dehydrogenase